jgi:hypothetical protein
MYGETIESKAMAQLAKEETYKYANPEQQYQMVIDRVALLKSLKKGETPPPGPAPKPEKPGFFSGLFGSKPAGPELPPGLPPGSKLVGTSGGKPVYEYVGQDGKTKRVIQGN